MELSLLHLPRVAKLPRPQRVAKVLPRLLLLPLLPHLALVVSKQTLN